MLRNLHTTCNTAHTQTNAKPRHAKKHTEPPALNTSFECSPKLAQTRSQKLGQHCPPAFSPHHSTILYITENVSPVLALAKFMHIQVVLSRGQFLQPHTYTHSACAYSICSASKGSALATLSAQISQICDPDRMVMKFSRRIVHP